MTGREEGRGAPSALLGPLGQGASRSGAMPNVGKPVAVPAHRQAHQGLLEECEAGPDPATGSLALEGAQDLWALGVLRMPPWVQEKQGARRRA